MMRFGLTHQAVDAFDDLTFGFHFLLLLFFLAQPHYCQRPNQTTLLIELHRVDEQVSHFTHLKASINRKLEWNPFPPFQFFCLGGICWIFLKIKKNFYRDSWRFFRDGWEPVENLEALWVNWFVKLLKKGWRIGSNSTFLSLRKDPLIFLRDFFFFF